MKLIVCRLKSFFTIALVMVDAAKVEFLSEGGFNLCIILKLILKKDFQPIVSLRLKIRGKHFLSFPQKTSEQKKTEIA